MIPCKDIVKMLSSGEDLPFMKRMELKMHLTMCVHCSKYARHLRIMKASFEKLFRIKTRVDPSEVGSLERDIVEKVAKKTSKG